MARSQSSGANDSVVLQKFAGLKNTVTEERLTPAQLAKAINIDIDDAGQIRRRRGATQVAEGNFHSVFSDEDRVIGVRDGFLGIIYPDYSFKAIKSNIGSAPICYVKVGDKIYFSSQLYSGVINEDDTVSPWGQQSSENMWLSPVVNPTSTYDEIRGKFIGAPPVATSLAYFNGRIYMANGSDVWATELYLYDYVDKTRNYLSFESEVTVIGAVTDGLYVGTKTAVWFMSGAFSQMQRILMMKSGALPGSLVSVPGELVNPQIPIDQQAPSKTAVLFLSTVGLCAGLDNGVCYNLTQNEVLFPAADNVAAMFRRQDGINQYVGVADSAGSPASAARIGDYVDAEIRRFNPS